MTMTDQEILDALNWSLDRLDEGDSAGAKDYIRQVRDEYDARQDAADEAMTDASMSQEDVDLCTKYGDYEERLG